jgi:simple sugar transport system permease protein
MSRFFSSTEGWLLIVILVLGALLSIATPNFLTASNLLRLLDSHSVTAILAMGVFVVLVAGGIDISFAATASIAQFTTAYLATVHGVPAALCIPLGLLIGLALGCFNAALIHYLNITSIIVTIATQALFFGLLMWVTSGKLIAMLPPWWGERFYPFEWTDGTGALARISLPVIVAAFVCLMTWVLMNRTTAGRQLFAMGGNPETARRLGINIASMHFLAYGYLGLMAGLAGLVQAHRVGQSVPNALVYQIELNTLAAAVLGGASLLGGIGTVGGVLLGILLLAMLQNGLNLLSGMEGFRFINSFFFPIVIGGVILIATSVTALSTRKKRRPSEVNA